MHCRGMSLSQIADKLGTSVERVREIITEKWREME